MASLEIGSEFVLPSGAEVDKPREHCGVWAIWDPSNPDLMGATFVGLNGIQHRGEGGAGVAVISPISPDIQVISGAGKVKTVFNFDGSGLRKFPADSHAAIAHTRWPTDVSKVECNQPLPEELLALAHNGQITNKEELARTYSITDYASDSDLTAKVLNQKAMQLGGDVERAAMQLAPELRGSFCITVLTKDKLIAFRDRNGIRPLQLGTTETGGYIVASENMAIDNVPGAMWLREIEPAEMVVIDKDGLREGTWAVADQATCMLEYVYLANKDTMLNGVRVGDARHGFGHQVAKRIPADLLAKATALIPLPNGANQITHGFAEATGIPFVPLMILNPDVEYGRSFIQPDQAAQSGMAGDKLIVDPELEPSMLALVEGQEVFLVDDSLIRSTTMKSNIPKIKAAGAKKIHVVVGAPKYVGTCDLGVDTPDVNDLIAYRTGGDEKEMANELGVASVTFPERQDMYNVVGRKVCDSCLGGNKPNLITDVTNRFNQLVGRLTLTDVSAPRLDAVNV